jgi:ATP-dependent exoDNAse (exonuclease V) beta subunit
MEGTLTVYKASAGSGKTFTLTAEYLATLLSEDPETGHRNILAVTFTNKATAEMKGRILQELWQLANSTSPIPDAFTTAVMERMTPRPTLQELRKKAATALHTIVHDYDHFYVLTIDAFFQSLLSSLAHELGLAAAFRVEIDDKYALEMAIERLLNNVREHPQAQRWILDTITQRIDDAQGWNLSDDMKKVAAMTRADRFLDVEERLVNILEDPQALPQYDRLLHAMLRQYLQELQEKATAVGQWFQDNGGYTQFNNGKYIQTYIARFFNGKHLDPPSATVLSYIEDCENMLRKADRKDTTLKAVAQEGSRKLHELHQLQECNAVLLRSCELTLKYLAPLRLVGEITREVTAINSEENRFMLAKTPILFDRLVGKDDASFVFERAGEQFRHIMIDEFQDTSPLQWRNFRRLLVENMSQGCSCLLVGDIKQAIYRFRGGDWKILGSIEKEFPGGKTTLSSLDTNFRSARSIIFFNNYLFPRAAAEIDKISDDDESGEDATSGDTRATYEDVLQQASKQTQGHVEVHFSIQKKKETGKGNDTDTEEGEDAGEEETYIVQQMIQKMRELHTAGLSYSEMAILVRRKSEGQHILSEMQSLGVTDIPVISDEAFVLGASSAVHAIIQTLYRIDDATHTVADAYVRHFTGGEAPDYEALAELPLYELVEHLVSIYRPYYGDEDTPFLLCLLDKVLDFVDNGQTTLRAFLNFWEDQLSQSAIPAGEIEGVRILTIHKSKGLAFHSVFIPFCHWPVEKNENNKEMMWSAAEQPPFDTLPLVPMQPSYNMAESVYAYDFFCELHDRRIERLNLMYVAFTRAKENLWIWALIKEEDDKKKKDEKKEKRNATMGDLLYTCLQGEDYDSDRPHSVLPQLVPPPPTEEKTVSAAAPALPNPFEGKIENEMVSMVSYAPHAQFRQSSAARDFISDAPGEDYIHRGKLLHYIFSTITTHRDVDAALSRLTADGLISSEKEATALQHLIAKRLEDAHVRHWFDGSWQIYNECNILSRVDGELLVKRPDRVMTAGNKAIVVDFKFGTPKPEYREQVTTYCQLMQHMGYSSVQGVLWYVYSGERDIVFDVQ